jgi:hypothetical protein
VLGTLIKETLRTERWLGVHRSRPDGGCGSRTSEQIARWPGVTIILRQGVRGLFMTAASRE